MIFDIYTLVEVIWFILPAYAANGLVPLVIKKKKLHRIDGGRKFFGEPLFGAGKSWEGLIFGSFIGILIATIEMLAFPYLPFNISPVTLTIVTMTPLLGLLLGIGALVGDLVGSFIKRRFKIERGKSAPLLDQEDFLIGSLFFASFLVAIKIEWVILLLVITPIIHWVASLIGYVLKVKKEPW